jgi:peptide/nickel transport system permease protein
VVRARHAALALIAALYLASLLLAPGGSLATLPAGTALLPPSPAHPFGTDDLGRDLLAAALQGGRTSLEVAAAATLLALLLGVSVGLIAALGPPALDEATMRIAEIMGSLPALLIAVLVAALFGGSTVNLALVLGLTRWTSLARIVRMEARALLRQDFLRAAIALGAGPMHLARRHLMPNLAPPIVASAAIVFGGAVLAEASLAFVGLGDPAATSWGQMAASGFALLGRAWWPWAVPTAALVLASGLVALVVERRPGGGASATRTAGRDAPPARLPGRATLFGPKASWRWVPGRRRLRDDALRPADMHSVGLLEVVTKARLRTKVYGAPTANRS